MVLCLRPGGFASTTPQRTHSTVRSAQGRHMKPVEARRTHEHRCDGRNGRQIVKRGVDERGAMPVVRDAVACEV